MKKLILLTLLIATGHAVLAQPAASGAGKTAAATTGTSTISPAKKQLVERVLKLQQSNVELLARSIAEVPAMQMSQQANLMLRQVPAEKREEVGKGMQADLKKYLGDTVPVVQQRGVALAPSSVGKLLEEQFTETELKQLIAMLESPINRKFSEQSGAMQRALQEKLGADMKSTIEQNLKTLDQNWIKRLKDAAPAATDKTVPPAPVAPGPTSK
jgi:uncharacterized protein